MFTYFWRAAFEGLHSISKQFDLTRAKALVRSSGAISIGHSGYFRKYCEGRYVAKMCRYVLGLENAKWMGGAGREVEDK